MLMASFGGGGGGSGGGGGGGGDGANIAHPNTDAASPMAIAMLKLRRDSALGPGTWITHGLKRAT